MNFNLFKLSPEEHAAHLAVIDKPQAWNPEADALRREQAEAVRFRAEQVLARIDNGLGGVARKQTLGLDQAARWN